MKKMSFGNWKKYLFEFIIIFVSVFAAFALDRWNEERKDRQTERQILIEIKNGLSNDIHDLDINYTGHKAGIEAVLFFRNILVNNLVSQDSLFQKYFNLFRNFVSLQNISGYETLKSKGLEIVEDDSLRSEIISLYEYDYSTLKKLEENYAELQFQTHYFKDINDVIAPYLNFNENGTPTTLDLPLNISDAQRKILLANLWKIQINRSFLLQYITMIKNKNIALQKNIEKVLN